MRAGFCCTKAHSKPMCGWIRGPTTGTDRSLNMCNKNHFASIDFLRAAAYAKDGNVPIVTLLAENGTVALRGYIGHAQNWEDAKNLIEEAGYDGSLDECFVGHEIDDANSPVFVVPVVPC